MKMKSRHSMSHWNQALKLGLTGDEVQTLEYVLSALAQDERFTVGPQIVSIWENGKEEQMYDGASVERVLPAINVLDDSLKLFLASAKGTTRVGRHKVGSRALDRFDLTDEQQDYASGLHFALGREFGFDFAEKLDPNLIIFASKIAMRRIGTAQ